LSQRFHEHRAYSVRPQQPGSTVTFVDKTIKQVQERCGCTALGSRGRSIIIQDRADALPLDDEDAVVAVRIDDECFIGFSRVVGDRLDGDRFARRAGSEGQRAALIDVSFAGKGGAGLGEVPNLDGVVEGRGEREGEGDEGRLTVGTLRYRRVA